MEYILTNVFNNSFFIDDVQRTFYNRHSSYNNMLVTINLIHEEKLKMYIVD